MSIPTILIAHTDEIIRDSLKEVLTRDFPLVVVETPEDVIFVLNSKTSVGLLFIEALPAEDDQADLFERIRAIQPKLAIIALTDEINEADALEAVRLGANGYIFTPVKPDELRTIAQQAMAKKLSQHHVM